MAVKTVQAVINGVTTTLTYNSTSKKYEATITAPATSSYNNNDGHYFPVTIKATDEAGNVTTKNDTDATLGSSLQLHVKEKTAPAITITYPTASALIINNKPAIRWKVTDNDSGVNQIRSVLPLTAAARLQAAPLQRRPSLVDMIVPIHRLQPWQMAATQLRSMRQIMTGMQLLRRVSPLRSIQYRRHCLSRLR